jgi:protocatechuate 3,4-dioxygenase, alpha subunit
MIGLTPSQTVGPFFAIGLPFEAGPSALSADDEGGIWVRGTVYDGAGEPVPDALIETWQTSPPADAGFRGLTRCPTDALGRYAIRTRKPATVPGPDGRPQAPHLAMSVFARGLLDRVVTRVYFADEDSNATDPILSTVDPSRRDTVIAPVTDDGYAFDVRLQGEGETVFFAI